MLLIIGHGYQFVGAASGTSIYLSGDALSNDRPLEALHHLRTAIDILGAPTPTTLAPRYRRPSERTPERFDKTTLEKKLGNTLREEARNLGLAPREHKTQRLRRPTQKLTREEVFDAPGGRPRPTRQPQNAEPRESQTRSTPWDGPATKRLPNEEATKGRIPAEEASTQALPLERAPTTQFNPQEKPTKNLPRYEDLETSRYNTERMSRSELEKDHRSAMENAPTKRLRNSSTRPGKPSDAGLNETPPNSSLNSPPATPPNESTGTTTSFRSRVTRLNQLRADYQTAETMKELGITENTYVFRSVDPKFIKVKNGQTTMEGNPESIARVEIADYASRTTKAERHMEHAMKFGPMSRTEHAKAFKDLRKKMSDPGDLVPPTSSGSAEASDIGAGLNVALQLPKNYHDTGHVFVKIRIRDLMQQPGFRVMRDIESGAQGLKPLYISFDGSVQVEIMPPKAPFSVNTAGLGRPMSPDAVDQIFGGDLSDVAPTDVERAMQSLTGNR